MRRAANRQSSIYLGKDGYWHGRVTVGRKDDGSLDRRHVMSKSKATVITKVRAFIILKAFSTLWRLRPTLCESMLFDRYQ